MAIHSNIPAWEIPMDRGAWWATVHGGHKESVSPALMSPSSAHYWQSPWEPAGNGEMGLEEPHPLRSTELRIQLNNWHKSCSWAFWWLGLEILTRSKTSFIIFISIANEEQWLPSTVVGCLGLGTYMFINLFQMWSNLERKVFQNSHLCREGT